MNEFEALGRKTLAYDNLHAEYLKLLGIVELIKSGEVDPSLILIAGDSWHIIPGIKVTHSVEVTAADVVLGPGASITTTDGMNISADATVDVTPQQ